jgi:hypothetical protein
VQAFALSSSLTKVQAESIHLSLARSATSAKRSEAAVTMAVDVAMNDMDIDFSMDAEVDLEITRLQAEAEAINAVRRSALTALHRKTY